MSRQLGLTIVLSVLLFSAAPLAAGTVLDSSELEVSVQHVASDSTGTNVKDYKTKKIDSFNSLAKSVEGVTTSPAHSVKLTGSTFANFAFLDFNGNPSEEFVSFRANLGWEGTIFGTDSNGGALGRNEALLKFQFTVFEPVLYGVSAWFDMPATPVSPGQVTASEWWITNANIPSPPVGGNGPGRIAVDLAPGTYDFVIRTEGIYESPGDFEALTQSFGAIWSVHMNVVPLPSAAWLGLGLLGALAAARRLRHKRGVDRRF